MTSLWTLQYVGVVLIDVADVHVASIKAEVVDLNTVKFAGQDAPSKLQKAGALRTLSTSRPWACMW